jgi:N-acetylmuramoyl-L-alanine amidase
MMPHNSEVSTKQQDTANTHTQALVISIHYRAHESNSTEGMEYSTLYLT